MRNTKSGKSRIVPLHPTTVAALARYTRRRDRLCPRPAEAAFFLWTDGQRLTTTAVTTTFRRLPPRSASPSHPGGGHPARTTCATASRSTPCSAGTPTASTSRRRLPVLSTYLGHVNPANTYWYLPAAHELLGVAADRLEASRAVRP